MRDDHGRMIKEINRNSHEKSVWKRIITVLACVVVFGTTYALILPAITMDTKKTLVCTEETASGHVHLEACKAQDGETLTCGYADYVIHMHDENCYNPDGNLICGLEEVKEHRHTEECYKEVPAQTEEEDQEVSKELICNEPEVIYHAHNEHCFDENEMLICKEQQVLKHQHTDQCFVTEKEEEKELQEPEEVEQTEEPEQQEPEEVKQPETEESEIEKMAPSVEETKPEIKEPENEETESKVPEAKSEETENLETKSEETENPETKEEKKEEKEITAAQREHKMTHKGKDYTVHVTFGEEAQLPTSVELKVEEIKQGSTEYQNYYKQAEEALPEDQGLMFCRFFDVNFIADGKKVEPKASVDVAIAYEESVPQEKGVETNAIHFAEDGIEVIPADVGENAKGEDTFTFAQDSFSVVGTAVSAINLSEGSYIFYRDGYALGVDDSGRVVGTPVTVDEKGYVYPVDSDMNINKIIWKYQFATYGTLQNAYNNRCLAFSDDKGVITLEDGDYDTAIEARIINNVIRIRGHEQFNYGYRYLGMSNGTLKVGIVFAEGDYFFGAKVANVESTEIQPGELEIEDQIKEHGIIVPMLNNNKFSTKKLTYTWYRSDNGKNKWTKVERKKVTGSLYNIAEDGSWLNVPLDGGADKYYKAVLMSVDGKQQMTTVESKSYHVPYYDQVQNGDFEEPVIPYDDNTTYNEHYQPLLPNGTAGMIWKTTASDGEIEFISVASDSFKELSEKWHRVGEAAKGKQFVELNAGMPGALYQDILTVPGSTMYWRLAHRGRGLDINEDEYNTRDSKDTMYVVAMSTALAEKYDVTTQEAVESVMREPSKYPGAKVYDPITDDNKKWYYHSGEYEVPNSQYLTRYFFIAGETSYDKVHPQGELLGTIGNHLDNIHFSTELPPPEEGKVNLEVNKTIVGLDETEAKALLEKLEFTIDGVTVKGSEFKNFKQNEDGSFSASYQVQIIIGSNETSVTKNISEKLSTAEIAGYTRKSTTYAIGENGLTSNYGDTQDISVTIADQGTEIISFVNTYALDTVDISILKINDETTPQALSGAVFSLESSDGTDWSMVSSGITVDDNGIASINNLLYDKLYRLTETKAPDGYSILTEKIYFKIQKENGVAGLVPYNTSGNKLTKWPGQTEVQDNKLQLRIINNKKAMLPETGSSGTHWIYMMGTMLVLASVILYGCQQKRRQGRRKKL